MTIKVGINGFGRIGRMVFRAAQTRSDIEIVAINDLLSAQHISYIMKYDSTHGQFNGSIETENNSILVNNKKIYVTSEKDPRKIQWNTVEVDVVVESTGIYLTEKTAYTHIDSGAKKVVITAPPQDDTPMFVKGVNFNKYKGQKVISSSSCTTNCLAPLVKIINDNFSIVEGLMTTVHAITSTQKTVDSLSHKNWRINRSAIQNIIPTSTGAAQSIGKIIPELNNKLTGIAFRVPTANVSVIDLTVRIEKSSSYQNIKKVIKEASEDNMKDVLGYTEDEVVSSDFNGSIYTAIFDARSSMALNNYFFKLIAWYDNEIGYSNKVLDLISFISR